MATLIGVAVFVALVIVVVLWKDHRSYKPGGGGHDVNEMARRAKLDAQEKSSRWSAGM